MSLNNNNGSSANMISAVASSMTTIVNIKLDRTNYPLWLAQILPILRSRDLMGYVDGSIVCPSKNQEGDNTINPAYTLWIQQDQMILSWINGSLTVLATVASKRSARATWEALEQRYASSSQNRILFLRNELLQTKKGEMSVADYLDKMNSIADNLALAGKPVDDDELVQIILNDLGPAFEMTVNAAQARDTPITYPTLEALLLTTERRMVDQSIPLAGSAPVNAFVAARGRGINSRGGRRGGFSSNRGGFKNPNNHNNYNNNNYQRVPGGNGDQFFGGNGERNSGNNIDRFSSNNKRPTCQICGKEGHPALDCYQRMNVAFEGRIPTKRLTAMASSSVNHGNNESWLLDTGANAHITPDLKNLDNPTQYNGNENIGGVGNESGISIAHSGSRPQDPEDAFPREV